MSASSAPRAYPEAGRLLRKAAAWWIAELAGLLPRSVVARLTGAHAPAILAFAAGQASFVVQARGRIGPVTIPLGDGDGPAAARIRRQYSGWSVPVRLDDKSVFETTIELPATAERSLEPILRHQLERLVPLDPAKLRFGWRISERLPARNVIRVQVGIVKQATLDSVTGLATRLGLVPRSVVGGKSGFLLWQAHPDARVSIAQKRLRRGLEVLAVLLVMAAYAVHIDRLENRVDALRTQVADERQQADAVEKLAGQAKKADRTAAFFGRRLAAPTSLAVLDALTRIVPRESWIEEFHLHAGEVELIGYAPRATDLVARIEHAALFRDPTFRSPVTLAPSGDGERFELGFWVKDPVR